MKNNGKAKAKVITVLVGIVVLVIVAATILHGRGPLVPVAQVTRENLSSAVTSNGKVEPIAPTIARAQFATFVNKVMATEGQAVRRGQIILTLDATEIRSQLAQARANLIGAQTDLRNAPAGGTPGQVAALRGDLQTAQIQLKNLERTGRALRKLVSEHAATQDELAQSQASLAKARANLQTLEAKKQALEKETAQRVEAAKFRVSQEQNLIAVLEKKLRSATVRAPSDGTLYSLPVRPGDYVTVGDVLAKMANLRNVRVRAFVDEPDLGQLKRNQEVEVTWDAKPGRIWKGRTEQIPKQVVARGMRSVGNVLCSIDNDQMDLLPNVNVQVRILVHERRGALVVPRVAVHEDGNQYYVFALAGNRVYRRDISVGIASPSKYEVLSGVALGDRVAEPIDMQLRNGMEIRPSEAK